MAVVLTIAKNTTYHDFEDYEVPAIKARRRQPSVIQSSFTGNLSVVYMGTPRYEFTVTFNVGRGGASGTLEKLDQVFQWRDSFTLFPFLRIDGGVSYTVIWPGESPFEESLVYGYREAMNSFEVTFLEARTDDCAGDDLIGKADSEIVEEGPGKMYGEWEWQS